MIDRAGAVIVLAKQPVPGRVKTRLQSRFDADEAAELAAAALQDTLDVVRGSRAGRRRILAWEGDPAGWDAGFTVVRQPTGDLNTRLDAAFGATFATVWTVDRPGAGQSDPVVLIGMDTPQVTAALLDADWDQADTVLGLSDDGGFWAIGLRRDRPVGIFEGIPMSTERTGAAQLGRLIALGLTVTLLPPLLDVDSPADAERVAYQHPDLQFSRTHATLVERRGIQGSDRLFDRAYRDSDSVSAHVSPSVSSAVPLSTSASVSATQSPFGSAPDPAAPTTIRSTIGSNRTPSSTALAVDVDRWIREADEVDHVVISRCQGPVIDLGCGPGRMVQALTESGLAALGVDTSAAAVALSRTRGAPTLRRDIDGVLPAEGRWGTALLMDGNIGIGGDVAVLLRRCRALVAAGGLILCEVHSEPDRHDSYDITLNSGAVRSAPMPWARIGSGALREIAAAADLLIEEEWTSGGRSFVAMRVVA